MSLPTPAPVGICHPPVRFDGRGLVATVTVGCRRCRHRYCRSTRHDAGTVPQKVVPNSLTPHTGVVHDRDGPI